MTYWGNKKKEKKNSRQDVEDYSKTEEEKVN